jgi:thioredoxin reductase (NADPH)
MDRHEQMFPRLTEAQIARISLIGQRRSVHAGEVLIEPGEQNNSFFVVLEGAVEVVRPIGGREEPITVHGPGAR